MQGPPVTGFAWGANILSIGQAPGPKEGQLGKPFAWTAGRTLFKWFGTLGITEAEYRKRVYMCAVCRCFPGKVPGKSGDRKPDTTEIRNCRGFLLGELEHIQPDLVIAIGKVAIDELFSFSTEKKPKGLSECMGRIIPCSANAHAFDLICLSHPSGLNAWNHSEEGKWLLSKSLQCIDSHPAWKRSFRR